MAIHVYHNPYFLDISRQPAPEDPDLASLYLAAIVATDDPEQAYRLTQHVHADWYGHPAVTTVVRSRSTSVGDVLETVDGRLLLVASFGFTELAGHALPVAATALTRALGALAPDKERPETALRTARYLYTALLFATPMLEALAVDVDRPDPYLALLARFAAEHARWALAQAYGGSP
jgi:hypothetical protein